MTKFFARNIPHTQKPLELIQVLSKVARNKLNIEELIPKLLENRMEEN